MYGGWRAALFGLPLLAVASAAWATTCRSVANGLFADPLKWDCACVPLGCDTLFIEHDISAPVDLSIASQLVQIESSGSLTVEGRLVFTQSTFSISNYGEVSALTVEFHALDSVANHGSIMSDSLMIFGGDFLNYGVIEVATYCGAGYNPSNQLLWNYGVFDCVELVADKRIRNEGTLRCSSGSVYHYYSTNGTTTAGSFFVEGRLDVDSFASVFVIDTLQIQQYMENYGLIQSGQFVNGWVIGTAQSYIHAGGVLQCGSFLNQDNGFIYGPGTICISGHSENHGTINAPITICDITLDVVAPPYLDVNTGGYLQPIYHCPIGSCSSVGISERTEVALLVYPVPAGRALTLDLGSPGDVSSIDLHDALGRVVRSFRGPFPSYVTVERDGLPAGIYWVTLRSQNGSTVATARVVFVEN